MNTMHEQYEEKLRPLVREYMIKLENILNEIDIPGELLSELALNFATDTLFQVIIRTVEPKAFIPLVEFIMDGLKNNLEHYKNGLKEVTTQ